MQLKTLVFPLHNVLQLHWHGIQQKSYQPQLPFAQLWPGGAVPHPAFVGTDKVHHLKNIDIKFLKSNLKQVVNYYLNYYGNYFTLLY